jgi:quercetin dioxygenase-like cupin family protein
MSTPIVLSGKGDSLQVMNEVVTVLVSGEETDGKYAVLESITQPNDGVPLLHTHPHQETFHVVEGSYEIFGRDEAGNKVATPAPAGTIVHVPSGAPHGFLNVGDTPGKLLLTVEPASMEDFFRDLGTPIGDPADLPKRNGPPDMEAVLKTCAKHGVHFVEAPPH